jgi:pimeloyl-ACP methyl ester carboxylesterase
MRRFGVATPDPIALAQRLVSDLPGYRDDAIAVVNGAVGDRLAAVDHPLAIDMTLFEGAGLAPLGRPPGPSTEARPRLCVLVHGLMGSERAWALWTRGEGSTRVEYGATLGDWFDVTPIYVRYNTGSHVSHNGRRLAHMISELVEAWPVPVEEVDIVAHSMGGLVARSACHYATEAGHAWVDRLQRVFLLGAPSHGAPLEQVAHLAAGTLDTIWNPWTKLIGKTIKLRSAGIKDLRYGYVLDEEWEHGDPDALVLGAPSGKARSPEHARWFVAAATLGEREGLLAKLVGDSMVTERSARGKGFRTPEPGLLPDATVRVFPHTSHVALMNDPEVLDQLARWWIDDMGP